MATEGQGGLAGQVLGGYHLLSLLGTGGMAEVYLAQDLKLGRQVAVKVLPATLAADPEYVQRFKNEARQVAALENPHIVPVYQLESDRGLLFLVMPVLRESLRDRLDRKGVLPPDEAVDVAVQIAAGLQAAHRLGLVHRDVKPENILLDASGQAMLGDFGIARQLTFARQEGVAPTLAASGLPVGTPEYMAPEQLRGESVDQRADIYGLGTVLYELLTGQVPFDADSPYEVAALVLREPPLPPSRRNPAIWPRLEGVVLRAMAKDPNERYQDAEQFASALQQAMGDRTVTQRTTARQVAFTPRATRRISHPSIFPPTAGSVDTAAPTIPDLPALGTRSYQALGPGTSGTVGEERPRNRLLMVGVAAMLLVASLCGLGATRFLFAGGSGPLGFGGDSLTPSAGTPTSSGTSYVGGGGIPTQPNTTDTPGVVGITPTATKSPTVAPSATDGQPSPTTSSGSPLTLNPTTIGLVRFNGNCYGQQTITNNSQQIVGWQWLPPRVKGFSYNFSSYYANWTKGWPQDMNPGLQPGSQEVLYLQLSATACNSTPIYVTIQDNTPQGNTYHISVQAGIQPG